MNFFGLFFISDWIVLTVAIFYVVYQYLTWNFGYWKSQNIKSVCPFPVFGSLWTYFFEAIHIIDKKAAAKFGKIWGIYEMREPCLVVADAELIKIIALDNFHYFENGRRFPLSKSNRSIGYMLPMASGTEWQSMRIKLSRTFTSKKLYQLSNLIEESVKSKIDGLTKDIEVDNNVNILLYFEDLISEVIAKSCFGRIVSSENSSDKEFIEQANVLSKSTSSFKFLLAHFFPKLFEAMDITIFPTSSFNYLKKSLIQVIGMRKQDKIKRNDFLQLLLNANEDKSDEVEDTEVKDSATTVAELSEDVLVSNTILFFLAGYDTVANTLSFTTYLLAVNQTCQKKLSEEIDNAVHDYKKLNFDVIMNLPYLDAVVSETLRLFPPIVRFERRCNSDCRLKNILVKKNMLIIVPIYAIHHSEHYYPCPEMFDPERFNPENKARYNREWTYLPFGVGTRNCLGTTFALMEIKMALTYFFKKFHVSTANNTEVSWKMKRGTQRLQPVNGIHLMVEKRN